MTVVLSIPLRLALLIVVLPLAGCGKSGVNRVAVSGKVTFQGQAVPSGMISFTPDATKGNRGPQGLARIVDGAYSTEDNGKGSVLGPQLVEIRGVEGSGSGSGDTLPFGNGKPLFPPYRTEVDIAEENATIDFEVPASRPGAS